MGELRRPSWLSAAGAGLGAILPPRRSRWLSAVGTGAGAILLLAMGLLAVWITRGMMGVQDGAVLTALILLPALLYIVLSGNLAELRGPGGWTATFARVASAAVGAGGERLDTYADVNVIQATRLDDLNRQMSKLPRDQPVIMTLTLGHIYDPREIAGYLDILAQLPRFRLVALLNAEAQVVGCVTPAVLLMIMRDAERGRHFINAIREGSVEGLEQHPGVLQQAARPHTTNAEVLRAMTEYDLSAIAIIDSNRRLRGVVEREELVSRLVLSLTAVNRSP